MSVEANIIVREVKGALLIPIAAVADGNVHEIRDGRVHRIAVKTGIRGARMVEILAGLGIDQTIVSPANPTLRDGARVRVQPASAAP